MTDTFGTLDSARATVEHQLQQARERSIAMTVLADQVTTITATVASSNGAVTVTATAAAVVTDVALSAAALTLAPTALGRLVTETIARAQRAAAELALVAAEESLGTDSSFTSSLRADVDARFGAIDEEPGLH